MKKTVCRNYFKAVKVIIIRLILIFFQWKYVIKFQNCPIKIFKFMIENIFFLQIYNFIFF